MVASSILLIVLAALVSYVAVEGFHVSGHFRANHALSMLAPKPSGISNTREGKLMILERTKKILDETSMIIVAPVQGVTKEQMDMLRKELPKGTKASVVKNSLLRVSAKGTPFENVCDKLRDQNVYFFVPEGQGKKAYEGYQKWQKEVKRTEPEHDAKAVLFDGTYYGAKDVETVVNLPTKQELYARLARALKSVPTKLAKTVKAVPTKVARAVACIRDKKEEEEKASV